MGICNVVSSVVGFFFGSNSKASEPIARKNREHTRKEVIAPADKGDGEGAIKRGAKIFKTKVANMPLQRMYRNLILL
jgi:hypothetical protein